MTKFSILSCALIALLALVVVDAESSQVEVHAESSQAKASYASKPKPKSVQYNIVSFHDVFFQGPILSGPHVSEHTGYTFIEWTKLLGKISPDCKLAPVRTLKELYILNALADESGIGRDEFLVGVFKDPHLALDCKTFGDRKGCLSHWNTFFGPVPYKDALWSKHTGYVLQPDGEPEEGSGPATIATVGGEYPTMSDNSAQKRYRYAAIMCECDAHSAFGDLPDFNVYEVDITQQNTAFNILAQLGLGNVGGIVNQFGAVADVTVNSFTSIIAQVGAGNIAQIFNLVLPSDVSDTNVQVNNVVNAIVQVGFLNFATILNTIGDAAVADTVTVNSFTSIIAQFGAGNVALIVNAFRGSDVTDIDGAGQFNIISSFISQFGFLNFAAIITSIGDSAVGDTGPNFTLNSITNIIAQFGVANIAVISNFVRNSGLADASDVEVNMFFNAIIQIGIFNFASIINTVGEAADAEPDFTLNRFTNIIAQIGEENFALIVNTVENSSLTSDVEINRFVNVIGQLGLGNFASIVNVVRTGGVNDSLVIPGGAKRWS